MSDEVKEGVDIGKKTDEVIAAYLKEKYGEVNVVEQLPKLSPEERAEMWERVQEAIFV